MRTDCPRFSVVIPTCRRNDALRKCLECLAPEAQSCPAAEYETIVADDAGDASELRAELQASGSRARWIAGPGIGPAANRNRGASIARGEWLLFTDDDCLPAPQWIDAYRRALDAHPEASVFEGRTHADRPRRSLTETAPINERGGFLWSCNFAIRRSLFEALGGFNAAFPYAAMEDVDLRVRLEARGERIVFVPEAAVCHPWRDSGALEAARKHEHASRIFYRLHPELRARLSVAGMAKLNCKRLLLETLPGLVRYRGRGFPAALCLHVRHVAATWRLKRGK